MSTVDMGKKARTVLVCSIHSFQKFGSSSCKVVSTPLDTNPVTIFADSTTRVHHSPFYIVSTGQCSETCPVLPSQTDQNSTCRFEVNGLYKVSTAYSEGFLINRKKAQVGGKEGLSKAAGWGYICAISISCCSKSFLMQWSIQARKMQKRVMQ